MQAFPCNCYEADKFPVLQRSKVGRLHGTRTKIWAVSQRPSASLSKRGLVHNLSYENEFYLHVNENSFSYERPCTGPCFQNEDKCNLELATCKCESSTLNPKLKTSALWHWTLVQCYNHDVRKRVTHTSFTALATGSGDNFLTAGY